jgi:hypothetical protein
MIKSPKVGPRVAVVLHRHNSLGSPVVMGTSRTKLAEPSKQCDDRGLAFSMLGYSQSGIQPLGCKHLNTVCESSYLLSRFVIRWSYLNSSAG